jgi:hypothetical protein
MTSEQPPLGSLGLVDNHSLLGVREKRRWKKCEKEVHQEHEGASGRMCDHLHGLHVRLKLPADTLEQAEGATNQQQETT